MSYEKHTWETGETITAEKLNNLEDGIASSGGGNNNYIVNFSHDPNQGALISDKTLKQIVDALQEGKNIIGLGSSSNGNDFELGRFYLIFANYIELNQQYSVYFFSVSMDGKLKLLQSGGDGNTNTWALSTN